MVVKICVGSSCHLKGSYDIIEAMKKIIAEYGVEKKVELKASFCLGNCKNGVTLTADKPDERMLHNVSPDNVREVFEREILPYLE